MRLGMKEKTLEQGLSLYGEVDIIKHANVFL